MIKFSASSYRSYTFILTEGNATPIHFQQNDSTGFIINADIPNENVPKLDEVKQNVQYMKK